MSNPAPAAIAGWAAGWIAGWIALAAMAQPPRPAAVPADKPLLGQMHASAVAGCGFATAGRPFEVVWDAAVRLTSIQVFVHHGDFTVVNGFRIDWRHADGSTGGALIGSDAGRAMPRFTIPAQRTLVGIRGAGGWWIDRIAFELDDGSVSPAYGGEGGDTEFRVVIAANKPVDAGLQGPPSFKGVLRGFHGTAGPHLESVGLLFFPTQ